MSAVERQATSAGDPRAATRADRPVRRRMTAGALLVVETRRTPLGAIQQAKDALTRNQARILGLVVNKLRVRDAGYGYGYGYGYGLSAPPEEPTGEVPLTVRGR